MSDPVEYCVVHDRPLDWCPDPEGCREVMRTWGLYRDDGGAELRRVAADELARLTEELGLYGDPGAVGS